MNGRKIFDDIRSQGFDCALFTDEISQRYLSDFHTTDGIVIISEKETALFTDSRYIESAESAKKAGLLSDDVNVYLFKKSIYETAREYFSGINAKRVCIDPKSISVKQAELFKEKCEDIEFNYY